MTSIFKHLSDVHLDAINAYLNAAITHHYTDARVTLEAAIRHSLLAPGKRVRPLLCIASQNLFSPGEVLKIMPVAAALEMIHTYSLIHDDLPAMDNDDFRRGLPTCHKAFDEATAILAGDALNTLAFQHMAQELPAHFPADLCLQSINYLAKAAGEPGMVGGQILDIYGSSSQDNIHALETLHLCKTGALIRASIVLPSILNKAGIRSIAKCEYFGDTIGLLFQVIDDILDVSSDKATLGKTPNKDIEQNKLTYVSLLGLEGAKQKAQSLHDEALDLLASFEADTDVLADFVSYLFKRKA
jgi:geranylgeranyl diphosphate synthase, type II